MALSRRPADTAVLRGFDIRRLAGVPGITAEASVIVPAHFIILAGMSPCLTLVYVLTQPVSLELISIWTLTGVTSWAVNTLILTHVVGEAALVDVLAGDCILCKFVALVTLTEEGANQVVAVVLTGTLHITFIYIHTTVIVACQLVTLVALTVVRALCVNASVHAVVGHGTLIFVNAVISVPLVARLTLADVSAPGVEACLIGATCVSTCGTFIYVSAEVLVICSESSRTTDGPAGLRDPLVPWKHPWELRLDW